MKHLVWSLVCAALPACSATYHATYQVGTNSDGNAQAVPTGRAVTVAFMSKQAAEEVPTPYGPMKGLVQDSTKVPNTALKTWGTVKAAGYLADTTMNASDNSRLVDVTKSNNEVSIKTIEASQATTEAAITKGLESVPK